ncbi:hypothetical protein [Streptomyces sp. NPDC050564]|uniref:hypothetical protein n=1 Tax=Streptomyces sp. NPDC050564 TaxID=3365631 RepID=UPI00379D2974
MAGKRKANPGRSSNDLRGDVLRVLGVLKVATAEAEQQRRALQEAAEREARRPVCGDCGQKFSDAPWKATTVLDWGRPRDSHPYLCDDCKNRATTHQAEQGERACQGQERERREAEETQPEQKTGGWLGYRWRS